LSTHISPQRGGRSDSQVILPVIPSCTRRQSPVFPRSRSVLRIGRIGLLTGQWRHTSATHGHRCRSGAGSRDIRATSGIWSFTRCAGLADSSCGG
jgi:hypothetical protein